MFVVVLRAEVIKQLSTLGIELIHCLVHPRVHIEVFIRLWNLGIDFLLHLLHFRQSGVEDVLGLCSNRAEDLIDLIGCETDGLLCIVVDFRYCGQSVKE